MKKILSLILITCVLSVVAISCVWAASDYTYPVIIRQQGDVYSVDYVFKVEGECDITAVIAMDENCLLDWNFVESEARLYISLASANPIAKKAKIAEVKSTAKIKLIAESLKVNGNITEVESFVPGDVTGDGEVKRSDLLRLAKHFSGFDVEIDEAASDVTGDGDLKRNDLLRLAKYFSGFDVKLGE